MTEQLLSIAIGHNAKALGRSLAIGDNALSFDGGIAIGDGMLSPANQISISESFKQYPYISLVDYAKVIIVYLYDIGEFLPGLSFISKKYGEIVFSEVSDILRRLCENISGTFSEFDYESYYMLMDGDRTKYLEVLKERYTNFNVSLKNDSLDDGIARELGILEC